MASPPVRRPPGAGDAAGLRTVRPKLSIKQTHNPEMVLNRKPDRQGLRFLFGLALTTVSIYAFYIGIARINSPELFLVPEAIDMERNRCNEISSGSLTACIPEGFDTSVKDGGIEIHSARERVRGSIEVVPSLPGRVSGEKSLEQPLIRAFLGDTRGMDTFELMDAILGHRYNPTLMGVKAALIPDWMKRDPRARILYAGSTGGLLFHTPRQSLGLSFQEEGDRDVRNGKNPGWNGRRDS